VNGRRPVILDFDGSVALDDALALPFREREEDIRFGCSAVALRKLTVELSDAIPADSGTVFLGSGDFHHITLALIQRLPANERIQVVVFDNHPDNMRYPFGVHCGSWVSHVSRLPFVSRVHVAGITSSDVERGHIWENSLAPLRSGKVRYWCVGNDLSALNRAGVEQSRSFQNMAELLPALQQAIDSWPDQVYLSIDKDVLARDVVQTNWDQGVMRLDELESAIVTLRPRLIGSDVVGEVSSYRYRSWFKRLLTALDRQPAVPLDSLLAWQARHREVNERLASLLSEMRISVTGQA